MGVVASLLSEKHLPVQINNYTFDYKEVSVRGILYLAEEVHVNSGISMCYGMKRNLADTIIKLWRQ